jgi:hypothetical protein
VRLLSEVFGLGVAILATVTALGRTPLRVLPLLPRSMMRLGRFRARLIYLWLLLLDLRLLMLDLMTVWPDVSYDTTTMAGRLSLFAEMLLDRLCNFKVSILTQKKFLPS